MSLGQKQSDIQPVHIDSSHYHHYAENDKYHNNVSNDNNSNVSRLSTMLPNQSIQPNDWSNMPMEQLVGMLVGLAGLEWFGQKYIRNYSRLPWLAKLVAVVGTTAFTFHTTLDNGMAKCMDTKIKAGMAPHQPLSMINTMNNNNGSTEQGGCWKCKEGGFSVGDHRAGLLGCQSDTKKLQQ